MASWVEEKDRNEVASRTEPIGLIRQFWEKQRNLVKIQHKLGSHSFEMGEGSLGLQIKQYSWVPPCPAMKDRFTWAKTVFRGQIWTIYTEIWTYTASPFQTHQSESVGKCISYSGFKSHYYNQRKNKSSPIPPYRELCSLCACYFLT